MLGDGVRVMFSNIYNNKTVLITGHTGFKGSWLTMWLLELGATVVGVSKDIPTTPSLFEALDLKKRIEDRRADLRDIALTKKLVAEAQPDFIFHLAAQAIVSRSYLDPVETVTTNVMGTVSILEALRALDKPCTAVLITSDKAYDNVEWPWGYRESDRLGGADIYSGSKGAAELVIKSYLQSFFRDDDCPVRIGIGRAGNVIGGGDWAAGRIVADCVRSWSEAKPVIIRSPEATRPWQHVLEPLSGYLTLGRALMQDGKVHGEAYNFGPSASQNHTVLELLGDLAAHWGFKDIQEAFQVRNDTPFDEARLLKLNCDKALLQLRWEANLLYSETVQQVGSWYFQFYRGTSDIAEFTRKQIGDYQHLAKERARAWAE